MHGFSTLNRCTVCSEEALADLSVSTASDPCTHCGHLLSFHVQEADGFVILNLLPNTNLDTVHIVSIGEALIRSHNAPRVIVNFSLLQFVSAGLLGHLLKLQEKIQAVNGTLVMCGLNQVVREIFQAAKLEGRFVFSH
jgi:anti-anti-sigma regulatory factor